MRWKPLNPKGFAPLVLVIATAAVLVVGGAGAYVYHRDHKTKTTATSMSSGNSSASTSKSSSSNTSSANSGSSTTAYLTISQWGVRTPYSGTDITTSPVSGNSNEMWINSQQLASACGSTVVDGSGNSGNLGYVGKYLPTDTIPGIPPEPTVAQYVSQNSVNSNGGTPAYAKVGDYYYIYWTGEPGCGASAASLVNQLIDQVGNLVDHLQASS